jgi:hypothetical protein
MKLRTLTMTERVGLLDILRQRVSAEERYLRHIPRASLTDPERATARCRERLDSARRLLTLFDGVEQVDCWRD